MTTRFNPSLLDRYIAPGASTFREAVVPDMTTEFESQEYWVSHLFLNNLFGGAYKPALLPYVTAYLRRAEGAFRSHALGRSATELLLRKEQTNPSQYSQALFHWEGFVGQATAGYAVLQRFIQEFDPSYKLFQRNDGSLEQRLWYLNNCMKHVESRISSGEVPQDSVSPVWMSNEGLQATDALLTWDETGEVLRDIGKWADALQNPGTLREWLMREDK